MRNIDVDPFISCISYSRARRLRWREIFYACHFHMPSSAADPDLYMHVSYIYIYLQTMTNPHGRYIELAPISLPQLELTSQVKDDVLIA